MTVDPHNESFIYWGSSDGFSTETAAGPADRERAGREGGRSGPGRAPGPGLRQRRQHGRGGGSAPLLGHGGGRLHPPLGGPSARGPVLGRRGRRPQRGRVPGGRPGQRLPAQDPGDGHVQHRGHGQRALVHLLGIGQRVFGRFQDVAAHRGGVRRRGRRPEPGRPPRPGLSPTSPTGVLCLLGISGRLRHAPEDGGSHAGADPMPGGGLE